MSSNLNNLNNLNNNNNNDNINFDLIIQKKLMKIKEKKSLLSGKGLLSSNNTSLMNSTVNHTNHSIKNNNNNNTINIININNTNYINFLPKSNYLKPNQQKNVNVLNQKNYYNSQNKEHNQNNNNKINQLQRRSNSSSDDSYKIPYMANSSSKTSLSKIENLKNNNCTNTLNSTHLNNNDSHMNHCNCNSSNKHMQKKLSEYNYNSNNLNLHNNIYNKYISSSISKNSSVKKHNKSCINKNNNKQIHNKNNSLLNYALSFLSKNKYYPGNKVVNYTNTNLQHEHDMHNMHDINSNNNEQMKNNYNNYFPIKSILPFYLGYKNIPKTSYSTKANSRKHSADKDKNDGQVHEGKEKIEHKKKLSHVSSIKGKVCSNINDQIINFPGSKNEKGVINNNIEILFTNLKDKNSLSKNKNKEKEKKYSNNINDFNKLNNSNNNKLSSNNIHKKLSKNKYVGSSVNKKHKDELLNKLEYSSNKKNDSNVNSVNSNNSNQMNIVNNNKLEIPNKVDIIPHSKDKKSQNPHIEYNSNNMNNKNLTPSSSPLNAQKNQSTQVPQHIQNIQNQIHNIPNQQNKNAQNVQKIPSSNDTPSKPSSNSNPKSIIIDLKDCKISPPTTLPSNEPDRDNDVPENLNDSLLRYVNANINSNLNPNVNESIDSVHSSIRDTTKYIYRDMELISSYLKSYYMKNKSYPTTKMNFYKYGRILGRGAFGKVNLCLHTLTGRLVAIKSINKQHLVNERQKSKIKLETSIMRLVSKCEYVVKIFETYETKKHFCIVMEYICAGDLLTYIKKRNKLSESIAKFIFLQIILGLQHIHSKNIVHRDIKLDNILIDLNNNIKICDFGVSRKYRKGTVMMEQCGTPAYIAPEILMNKGYEGFGVDIWSAGVVLYAMLSGTVPFRGTDLDNLNSLIMKGEYPQLTDISKDASHLIKCLLEVDPKKRISISNILVHPWLTNVSLNKNNYNLFTKAENIILDKTNIDYREAGAMGNIGGNIENEIDNNIFEVFDVRNLDTVEKDEKNAGTKSFILAPFCSSVEESDGEDFEGNESEGVKYYDSDRSERGRRDMLDCYNKDLVIKNGIIKFSAKVKELNKNYELNNNGEIDNGVIISPNDSNGGDKDYISNAKNSNNKYHSSKVFSPIGELDENYNKNVNNNKAFNNEEKVEEEKYNSEAIDEMVSLGYNKNYLIECLDKNIANYATAGYYLLVKYSYNN